jgi:hypothetical protein
LGRRVIKIGTSSKGPFTTYRMECMD